MLHTTGNRFLRPAHGEYIAEGIRDSRFVSLDGADHLIWVGPGVAQLLAELEHFITGGTASSLDRTLATMLFTDLVGSTDHLARVGDRAWAELIDTHDLTVRSIVAACRGRIVDTAGDGVFAMFDSPSHGLDAAAKIHEQMSAVGLRVRAGVHIGEIELVNGRARGVAVHTAARVMAQASGIQTLATRMVRDLSVGSLYSFTSVGERTLKGVPEPLELFEVSVPPK